MMPCLTSGLIQKNPLKKTSGYRTRIAEITNRIEQLEKELNGPLADAGMDEIKKSKIDPR